MLFGELRNTIDSDTFIPLSFFILPYLMSKRACEWEPLCCADEILSFTTCAQTIDVCNDVLLRSFSGISEQAWHEDVVSGRGEVRRVERVERIVEDLLVESVHVDGPKVFHVRVVLLAEAVLTGEKRKYECVRVLTEETMRSEESAVFAQNGEDGALACELVNREPGSRSHEKSVAKVVFTIALQFHLSRTNRLLIRVELAQCLQLAFDSEQVRETSQRRTRSLVLSTFVVLAVNIVRRKSLEVLPRQLLVVVR